MKTKTIFKKSALLVTVIALAVVMSLAAVVAFAAAGANNEEFAGVSVSTSGNVTLKFYYNSLGDADTVKYMVEGKSPVTIAAGTMEPKGGKYVIEVPLAAAEMTLDVTVWTEKEGVQGTPHTWSVKKYSDKILYDDRYADYHQSVRSMLVYGAMAQNFFGVNTGELATAGVFYGNTNPSANVTDMSQFAAGTHTDGSTLKYTSLNVYAESYTKMRFYFDYNGTANLTAHVSRQPLDNQPNDKGVDTDVKVRKDTDGYFVEISNISAMLYNAPYTVTVTDGADTLTMTKSVGNYLAKALTDGNEGQKSVAKAMYQFYLMTAPNVELDTESCEHANFHLIMRNDKTYSVVCSDCFLEDKQVAATGIADYISAFESVIGRGNVGTHYVTADADGTFYHRFYGSKTDGQDSAEPGLKSDGINAKGKYLVFKIRTNYTTSNEFGLYIRLEGQSAYYYARLDASKVIDGEWNVFVVDMSKLIQRWGDGDDVNYELGDPDQNGNQWYPTIIQSWLFNIAPGVDHTTKYIDVAYAAVVEEFDDIAVLVGNEAGDIYSWDGTQGVLTKKTVDDYCSGEHTYVSDANGHKENSCDVCGFKGSAYVAHSYTYDSASGKYVCVCGYSVGKEFAEDVDYLVRPHEFINQNPGGNATIDNGIKADEDGTVYRQIGLTSAATSNYFNVKVTKGNNLQVGRYLVYKVRTNVPNPNDDTFFAFAMHDGTGHKYHKMPDGNIFVGDWVVGVIDLEKVYTNYKPGDGGKYPWMTADTLLVGWGRPAMAGYTIDFAYLAVVDSIADVVGLIEDEKYVAYSEATESATFTTKGELCAIDHDPTYTNNGDGTHTVSGCDVCGLKDKTVGCTYDYDQSTGIATCTACGFIKTLEADTRNVAKIILIGGQSNAEGTAWGNFLANNFEADRIAKFTNGFSNVTLFARTSGSSINTNGDHRGVAVGGVAPVKAPTAADRTFGPEVGLAEYLEEKYPGEKFYIMKYAVGGSMLGRDWIVGENGEENGLLLQAFEKKLQNSLTYVDETLNMRPEIVAFLWMQGEGDAQPGWYEYYEERQLALINYIRDEYAYYAPSNGIAFIDAGISDARHDKTGNLYWPKYVEINQAKQNIAAMSDMNYYIDTIGAGMSTYEDNTDYAHYGVKSMITLGRLFGEKVAEVLNGYSRGYHDISEEPVFEQAPTDNENAILELDYNKIYNDGFRDNNNHTATLEDGYVHIAFNATGSVWLADPDSMRGNIPADKFVQYKWGARYLVIKYRANEELQGYFYPNPSRESQVGWEMLHFTLEAGNGTDWQYKVIDLYDNAVFAANGPYLASFATLFSASISDKGYTRPEGATLDIAYMNFYSFEHGVDCVDYTYDENGHSRPACDVCGMAAVETEAHSYTIYDAASNQHKCACGYGVAGVAVNDSVNDIVRPNEMNTYSTFFTDKLGVKVEDGVVYYSITGLNLTKEEYSHGFHLKNDGFISGARYIVLKVRSNVSTHSSWQLHFNGGSGLVGPKVSVLTAGEWITYVIDMQNMGHAFYKPDANGKYPTFTSFFLLPRANAGDYTNVTVDVAYIATVKDIEGVFELVNGDDVAFQNETGATKITNADLCLKTGSNHDYTINNDGTHTTPSCDKCGLAGGVTEAHSYTYNSTNNSYDCVCGYSVAGVALNDSVSHIARPETVVNYSGYNALSDIKEENGIVYRTQTGSVASANNGGYAFGWNLKDDDTHTVGARFIVIKLRTNAPTANFTAWQLHCNGGSGNVGLAINAFTPGEWTTLVIDMKDFGHTYYKPTNGVYPEFKQFLLLPWAIKGDYTQYTLDFAYVATVKDIEGVVELVDGDDIMFQTMKGSATKMTNAELCAMTHTAIDNGDGTHTVAACANCGVEASTAVHTYGADKTCVCGKSISDIEFYYGPSNLMGSNNVGFTGGTVITDADGTQYMRMIGNNATASNQAYFNIMNNTTITTGGARYVAIKVRTNLTNYSYFNFFANFGSTSAKGIIMSSAVNGAAGEWVTIVLDLASLYSANGYTATDGAYPDITRMALICENDKTVTPDDYVDVAYVAFADTLADLAAIIDQPTVQYSSAADRTANKFIKISTADDLVVGGHYWSANELEGANGIGFSGSGVTSEGGVNFVRVTGNGTTADGTARFNIETATTATGTGRYVAIKVRTNTKFAYFNFMGQFSGNSGESGITVAAGLPGTEDWVTIVIDLEKCYSDKNYTKSGHVYPNFTKLQLILQTGAVTTEDQYVDVAYVAMASTLADLAKVIDQPTVEYFHTQRVSNTHETVTVADLATMQ